MFKELREKDETCFEFSDLNEEEPWLKNCFNDEIIYPTRIDESEEKELFLSLIDFAKNINNECNKNWNVMQFKKAESGIQSWFMSENNLKMQLIVPIEVIDSELTDEEIIEYIVDFLKRKEDELI